MALSLMAGAQIATAAETMNKIEKIDFVGLPGDKMNINITLSEPVENPPAGFTLNNPARIALDFPGIAMGAQKNSIKVDQGVLRSLSMAEAKGRTRMVLNLTKLVGYSANAHGRDITIELQGEAAKASTVNPTVTRFAESQLGSTRHTVSNIDFARGKNGEGRVTVDLSDNATGIDIRQQGGKILVDFIDSDLPENLQRRLNVTNFATPVLNVDAVQNGKNVRMTIEPKGTWEHSAYQTDKKFIVDVRQVVEDPNRLTQGKQGYKGDKLSLNFQNIEVRSVLQVIADFTGFNIITSDSVSGSITLRLKDVPWDQALDIIMQARGLGMRKNGNVILIAPSDELAAKEKQRLEAERQIDDLEPLVTEIYTLKYHTATALKPILTDAKQKILSPRGSAVFDPRTNTIFVQDTKKNQDRIQMIISKVDIPVKQVLIEGRIVLATDGFSKSLGAKFGLVGNRDLGAGTTKSTSGVSVGNTVSNIYNNHIDQVSVPSDLNVNLPVTNPAGTLGFQIYDVAKGLILNMELSAAESDSRTKTISSPRVIATNQQKAVIESGVEIPYQEASSSGATSVSFKKATLGLEVTPLITPDNRINMDLLVKKDSKGEVTNGVPAINTNQVQTNVLVGNGETVVLGGIFEELTNKTIDKVPFFGDIPVLGRLFRRDTNATSRNELLIFISPKIIDEQMNTN
jgi:type IV pilus assembly protein PilQ